MFVVKMDYLCFLNRPIWKTQFGENKTWRGFVMLPILNGAVLFLLNDRINLELKNAMLLGVILGLAYMLSELPNSFIKRRMGIKAGENAESYSFLSQLIDKLDSVAGVLLTYYLLGYTDVKTALILLALGSGTHIIVSYLLVQFNVKKSF